MYKVFIENVPVIFQKACSTYPHELTKYLPVLKTSAYEKLANLIKQKTSKPIRVNLKDNTIESFFSEFKFIEAAGGIVINENKEALFIKRNGVWDLPKGKIEKKESPEEAAVREIEEECGIKNPMIKKHLINTYHTYNLYGNYWLKKTYWYLLSYDGDDILIPQKEEGISNVKWLKNSDFDIIKQNTYGSIIDVLESL